MRERERGSIISSRPIGKSFNLGLWAPATSTLVKVHATAPFFFFQMLILKIQCLAASHKKPNLFYTHGLLELILSLWIYN